MITVVLPSEPRAKLKAALRRAGSREIGGVLMAEQLGAGCFKIVDGRRFAMTVPVGPLSDSVVLAVSVSYPITDADLSAAFSSLPVIRLTLEEGGPHSHWSDAKQGHLADQFLRAAIDIGGRGARRIHLVLAAPNSIVFRFGRAYDKRNLPELVVYQFEKGVHPPYPWGVLMPTGQVRRAEIVRA